MAFGKVFYLVRLSAVPKKLKTRHLIEFWMMEPEMAFMHQDQSLGKPYKKYVAYLVQSVLDNCDIYFRSRWSATKNC